MDGISMLHPQDLLAILGTVSIHFGLTYKLQSGVLMDSTQHLLSLISKFPSGIRGIELRFALRMKKSEFVRLAQSSLIDKTISLTDNDLSDFEEGKFKLSADLYFERAEQTPVPKIVCDLHEALQKRPQGLSIHELHNQTHHSIQDLERQIFIEKDFGFVQVKTDEYLHTKYSQRFTKEKHQPCNTKHIPLTRSLTQMTLASKI